MSAPFPEETLGRLSAYATAQFGLRFPPDRWHELGRGIASAALELGVSDLQGWAEKFAAGALDSDDRAAVANHLTISETYFFRHPESFATLETDILPERIAKRHEQCRGLRIWSAGCASGEEPYSVAILLRQKFPAQRADRVTITGTDLNSQVVARAARGSYSEWSFRDAPPWLKPGYFERGARGHYQISAEIRGMVRFSVLNLAAPLYPAEFGERGDFDVILCRNVLMYFSGEWRERIVRRFVQALAPGGWLMVGPCDLTAAEAGELRLRLTTPGIYQKMDRAVFTAALPPMAPAAPEAPAMASIAPIEPPLPAPSEVPQGHLVPASASAAPELPAALQPETLAEEIDTPSLARHHANRGELAEALATCDRAISSDNLNSSLHHLRGCVLLELNRVPEAEQAFRRVLYLDPGSVMAEFALASLALRAGREEEARHRYGVILRLLERHLGGEAVPLAEGVTVARLRKVVEQSLENTAA